METLAGPSCGVKNFASSGLETKSFKMSSVLICPNCRSTLSSCLPLSYPVMPLAAPCQGCHQGVSDSCLAGEVMSQFSLPYVCRHWMHVSDPTSCYASYLNGRIHDFLQAPSCTQPPAHISFTAHHPPRHENGSGAQPKPVSRYLGPKDSLSKVEGSLRGGSPEGTLIQPDVMSLRRAPVAKVPRTWTKMDDARVLAASKESLQESGWYYGALSWREAAALLAKTNEGTFLIRDSSSSHCPYALSVQTPQGPTSIRVEYEMGKFWLACEKKGVTPQLGGVIELVEFYRALARENPKNPSEESCPEGTAHAGARHVWIDHQGKVFSPIRVVQPLKREPSSLQHLCRLAARGLRPSQVEDLPAPLRAFVQKYPHDL